MLTAEVLPSVTAAGREDVSGLFETAGSDSSGLPVVPDEW